MQADTRAPIRATRLLFVLVGVATAAWAPLVPFVKERAGLDEHRLGLLLLGLGIGSILAMPVSGALAARFGFRAVIGGGIALSGLSLPGLATLTDPLGLAACLAVFGAGLGAVDCVMNLQAVAVEKAAARPMMSGFHGFYSLGCILGSGAMAGLLALGLGLGPTAVLVAASLGIGFLAASPGILARGPVEGPAGFAWPRGRIWLLGILCFIVFLTEGQALDWSAVFLREHRGLPAAFAGLGFAAFSVTMTIGRLTGDRIVARLGPVVTLAGGGLVAAAGLGLVTAIDTSSSALLGYGLIGAGCANIVPVLFSAAGRDPDVPASVAIPAVTTLGYAGILVGPALIGFVAAATSLPFALAAIAILLLGLSASAGTLRR